MADNENTELFKFDLDNAEFVKKVLESKGLILEMGDAENLSGLIKSLTEATAAIGVMGVAFLAIKTAIDWVEEAEKIKRVNAQFDMLAESAGLVGKTLREDLLKATGGLAADTDAIERANKEMVLLGKNAEHMGEIMELARKRTTLAGGDLLDNFEQLSRALATGQQKTLKSWGIQIDVNKATKAYADSINEASGNLSAAGKQQALFNAGLEAAQLKYKNVKADTDSAKMSIAQIGVVLKETSEASKLWWERIAGGTVRNDLSWLLDFAKQFKTFSLAKFGEGTEKTAAQITRLNGTVEDLNKQIVAIEFKESFISKLLPDSVNQKTIANLKALKENAIKEIDELQKKVEAGAKREPASAGGTGGKPSAEGMVDLEAKKAAQAKYYTDIAELRKLYEQQSIAAETNIQTVSAHIEKEKWAVTEQTEAKIAALKANTHLTGRQKDELELQERKNLVQQLNALDKSREKLELQIIANLKTQTGQAAKDFANGWKATTLEAGKKVKDFGKLASDSHAALTSSFVAGFTAMGDGSKSAAEAMKGAFLGALGDMAISKGSELIAESIWPPNPLEFGAGGALIALGGKLKSLAGSGGGGASVSPPSGGGGGTVTAPPAPEATDTSAVSSAAAQNVTGRSVGLHFHGTFVNTEENARWVMEMMRKETDTTAFDFYKVGGK